MVEDAEVSPGNAGPTFSSNEALPNRFLHSWHRGKTHRTLVPGLIVLDNISTLFLHDPLLEFDPGP